MTKNQKVLNYIKTVQIPTLFAVANEQLQEAFTMLATAVRYKTFVEEEIYIDRILELCRTGR